jgi:ABC-type antimicrobial peptide transport system permease subunit
MKGDAADGARLIAREAASVDAAVKVWVSTSFVNFTEAAFAVQRIAAELLLVLGVVSILLAAMGIYGVIAFSVNQRVREIGIRMALGARRADVKRLILRQGLMLAAAGCVVGLVGSALAGRLMANLLIGVGWFEPSIVCGVVFGLMAVAALACWFPARRAAGVDPMLALRAE